METFNIFLSWVWQTYLYAFAFALICLLVEMYKELDDRPIKLGDLFQAVVFSSIPIINFGIILYFTTQYWFPTIANITIIPRRDRKDRV